MWCLVACCRSFFILMHFVTFTSHGAARTNIYWRVAQKEQFPSPTISPNLSRNAGSFFSFELLKSMDMYRLQVINCRSQITHHRFVAIALQWIDHIAAYNAPSIRRHCITMNSTQFLERTMKVEIIVQETFHHSHNYGRQWNSLGPSLFTIVRVRFISWIFKLWSKIVGGSYCQSRQDVRFDPHVCLIQKSLLQ